MGILDFGSWGFWILDFGDFGLWIFGILDFGDFGFWGLWDFGFWILGPKSKIPQSKIQNPNFFGRFWGFWILDRYVANLYVAPNFGDFGFWGFGILGILDLGDFGFWGFWGFGILDFGDFGFWIVGILDRYVANLYVRPPTPQIWGFGILDFGDFGFWNLGILDFGDFGF